MKDLFIRARQAATSWRALDVQKRTPYFQNLRLGLVESRDALAQNLSRATGAVPVEALISEFFPVLDLVCYYEQEAAKILRPRRLGSSLIHHFSSARVEYRPYGVVLVLAPSNYPFQLSLAPAITAAWAGNAVIVKMSEHQRGVASLLREGIQKAGFPENLFQWVEGDASIGRDLIAARPDKIFLTGSAEVGIQVLHQAADLLIPVDLELGGSDPMIVLEDADLERTSRAAVYGAFCNAGQVCVSVRRAIVHESLYPGFLSKVVSQAKALRTGDSIDSEVARIIRPAGVERLKALVDEAVAAGARQLMPWQWEVGYLRPMILADVKPTMRIMNEEVFAPVMLVCSFANDEQAVDIANASPMGLGSSLWTRNKTRAYALASRLEAGGCSINEVMKPFGRPDMPFGGVKRSGFGRTHGPEGLLSFVRPYGVAHYWSREKSEGHWYPYDSDLFRHLSNFMHLRFGPGSFLRKAWQYRGMVSYFHNRMKRPAR